MEEVNKSLNQFLCDLNVFFRKLQNYHWNIQGEYFFTIHAKLEEYYDEINEQIDEVAEFILSLGGQPLGRMKDYLEITTIKEAENKGIGTKEVFDNIIADFNQLLKEVKEIKKEAENIENCETSTFMDEFTANYIKKLWMLKQTMK